jgi:hypothetical protein
VSWVSVLGFLFAYSPGSYGWVGLEAVNITGWWSEGLAGPETTVPGPAMSLVLHPQPTGRCHPAQVHGHHSLGFSPWVQAISPRPLSLCPFEIPELGSVILKALGQRTDDLLGPGFSRAL